MASPSLSLLLFSLFLLAGGGAARPGHPFHPCNTLFISYTTIDLTPIAGAQKPSQFAVLRYFRPLHTRNLHLMILGRPREAQMAQSEPSVGLSSLQERAKDILVVVAGLLFGVGCGALTGTIMYLGWSLFTNQYEIFRYGDEEEEDDEEDEGDRSGPKKMGYVKIAGPASAKEGYEGH